MPPKTLSELIYQFIVPLISDVTVVIASLALLAFFWGLVKFISAVGGDEKAIKDGKNLIKWGLIGLFVMVSVWGIIRFFYTDIGFTNFGLPLLPPKH